MQKYSKYACLFVRVHKKFHFARTSTGLVIINESDAWNKKKKKKETIHKINLWIERFLKKIYLSEG